MAEDGFRNRHDRFTYLIACENARRILADHGVLEIGREHLQRFAGLDPRQRDGYAFWIGLLERGPEAVARMLVDRSEAGEFARQTAPSFGGLPARLRAELLRRAREPVLAAEGAEENVAEWSRS